MPKVKAAVWPPLIRGIRAEGFAVSRYAADFPDKNPLRRNCPRGFLSEKVFPEKQGIASSPFTVP
jgi:hypothetical protein